MLKKILCLVLSVCMVLTMFTCITATADTTPDIVATVTTSEEGDGSFKITFASTSSSVEAFQVVVPYDKSKYTLLVGANPIATNKIIFNQNIEGSIIFDDNAEGAGVSWYTTNGMMLDKNTGETLSANSEGLYEIAYLTFNLNKANLTDDDYLNKLKLEFNAYSFAAPTDKVPTKPFVEFNIPDTRTEIEGLTLEGKEVEYNGAVIEAPVVAGADSETTVEYKINGGDVTEIKDAGTYTVEATAKKAGYKPTVKTATVVVNKKPVTVTVAAASKVYGEGDPELKANVEGLVGADTLNYEVARATGENAGTYAITATIGENKNYEVTTNTPAEFTITKKPVTVTVAAASKVYGEGDPELKANVEGLVGADTLNYEVVRATGEDVGTYAITATIGENKNYEVTTNTPAEFTITKAAYNGDAIVVAKNVMINKAKSYEVDMTSAISAIKGADVVSAEIITDGAILSNVTTDANSVKFDVASYAEETENIASIKVVVSSKNYENFDAIINLSTVDKVELTITGVTVAGKTYDAVAVAADKSGLTVTGATEVPFDNETLVYKYEGTGETVYSSTEAPVNAGTYNLVVAVPEENENYSGSFVFGFEIAKKKATIKINDAEKYVGAEDPEFTGEAKDFLGDDAAAIVYTRTPGTEAGTYDITASIDNKNYDVDVLNENDKAVFTIKKYNVTVTAPTVTVYFGNDIPELKATVTIKDAIEGLINEINVDVEVWDGETKVVDIAGIDNNTEKTFTTKAVVTCDEGKFSVETPVEGKLIITEASGRPSGGGTVIKPATKPEDDKKDDENKDDETGKPAASANIALKEDAKEVKFIEGFEDKTFRPDVNATRNEVVSALTALFDISDVKNAPAFTDTDDKAIKELAAAGVINGYEDGSFKGHNDVTRAEFVKLVAAALKLEAAEGATANFSDIDGHWAAEFIKTFVGKGYLVGYPDGTFRPESKITRAEMVVVMTRVVGTVDAEAAINFADLDDSHWAYEYIKKAAK